jgi:hypothetical protein
MPDIVKDISALAIFVSLSGTESFDIVAHDLDASLGHIAADVDRKVCA